MGKSLFRYNAYTGIRNAGVVRVKEVVRAFSLSQSGVLVGFLRSRLNAMGAKRHLGETAMPLPVKEKFSRLKAIKMLAYCDEDGYPDILPALSLLPADERTLVFRPPPPGTLAVGKPVAACVITFEPVAYQIKGRFVGIRGGIGGQIGLIAVNEVYSACPPLPGERLA